MNLPQIAKTILAAIGLAYFLDIQTDGDIDLPHYRMPCRLGRAWEKIKKLLKR